MTQPELYNRYEPPKRSAWQGRVDADAKRYHEIVSLVDLSHEPARCEPGACYGLLGFACDEGIRRNQGRVGAKAGPDEIRRCLGPMPVHGGPEKRVVDFGNIVCHDENLEESQEALANAVTFILQAGIRPILLGGGHEIAWGHYMGIARAFPGLDLGIVNFDAHFDMRPLVKGKYGNSGTGFLQIAEERHKQQLEFDYTCIGIQTYSNTPALFAEANRESVIAVLADDMQRGASANTLTILDQLISKRTALYVTVCMDVFAASCAPGVSAPQVLGLHPWQILPLLQRVASSGKVLSFDVAELSPPFDSQQMTAKLSAAIISTFITWDPHQKEHHLSDES